MFCVRQCGESDISAIEEILADAACRTAERGQPLWDKAQISWPRLSKDFAPSDFYMACQGDEPAGCMALVDYDPVFWPDLPRGASLFTHKLAVKRPFAGKGAADALFAFAEQEARLRGVGALSLDCHAQREKLRAVYERRGFACLYEKTLFGKYATAFYQKEILPAGLL